MERIKTLDLLRSIAMNAVDATHSWAASTSDLEEDLADIAIAANLAAATAGIDLNEAIKKRLEKRIGN